MAWKTISVGVISVGFAIFKSLLYDKGNVNIKVKSYW